MRRTLLLGLDGLCWPGLVAARRQGLVPNLARLADGGATGLLCGVPMLGRMGAAGSIATGHWPEDSGLWHDSERWAGGIRPVTMASWRRPPAWAALAAAGVATAGVGWPGSAPGAAACHVDDRFALINGQTEAGWALPPDCCPPAWRPEVAGRRVHPSAIATAHLLPLVDVAAVDQNSSDGLVQLATGLAMAASVQGVAAWLLHDQRADCAAVWLRWLGDVRAVATDAPPPWHRVEPGAWQFLDMVVGSLAAVAADRQMLIVGSGWRDAPGVLLATGGGIGAQALPAARLIDVAPTLLAAHGLHDPALPGRALALWPGAALRPVATPALPVADDAAAAEAARLLAPLIAEGHVPLPEPPPAWTVQRLLGLGRMLLPRDAARAQTLADAALALLPDHVDVLTLKAWCRLAARDAAGLDAIGQRLAVLAPDRPWAAVARGAAAALAGNLALARPWLEAAAQGDGESRLRAAQGWLHLNHAATARPMLARLVAQWPHRIDARLALAQAAQALGDMADAEAQLRAAIAIDPFDAALWGALESLLASLGRRPDADQVAGIAAQLRGQ
ncbi:MAG: alkaline phosphatase family protein [Alphaproteobacteria bacterium]|nr:alkaline phosphatase family protein [Alphaproteobacteria bacterium]